MIYFRKYILLLGFSVLLSTHLQAAISDDDISRAVALENRNESESLRLRGILKGAVDFDLTYEAIEGVKESKSIFMSKTTPLPELAQYTESVLKNLGLSCALRVDRKYGNFSTIEGLHDQLAYASFVVWHDITDPLNRLSTHLSIRDGVKNSDPDGRLAGINAVVAKWGKARAFTGTAAIYLRLNHGVGSILKKDFETKSPLLS